MMSKVMMTALAAQLALFAAAAHADATAAHGKTLYRVYCTQCHGVGGDGKGVNAPFMSIQPRDHTDSAEMGARTDADLFKAIKEGGKAVNKSVLMPSWKANLGDDDIHALVAYLRELCCQAK